MENTLVTPILPHAGQTVIIRNRPALVRSVEEQKYRSMQALHEVQVDYIDGWSHPESDFLIWELERGARVVASLALPRVDDLNQSPDPPALLRAFLRAHQWSALNRLTAHRAEDEGALRLISPWQSSVQVEDYQLYPVLKSLLMPRISLLLADDVGLGKTIEAGLILSELFVRRRIRRVLIICPASLQIQWRDEMREKFHLDFTIVDREETFRLQRDLGVDSNPWASHPRIITSMDYLRQQDVLGSFLAATKRISGRVEAILPWQMLVVDEVHNLTPARYGDDSERCDMLRRVSPLFEHRLFLSATPHNGFTVSFTGLLELLDPVRFQQKAILNQQDHEQVGVAMVRRLKRDLTVEGEPDRFAPRKVDGLPIRIAGAEKALFEALRAYRQALHTLLGQKSKRERHLGEFLIKLLTKRLLSSSYAFARTWWQHVIGTQENVESLEVTEHSIHRAEATITDDQERGLREEDAMKQTGTWLQKYAQELIAEQQLVSRCLENLGWSQAALERPFEAATLPTDARWERLVQWIDEFLRTGANLRNDERLIIFTEYKHTLEYLLERFKRIGLKPPLVQSLFGGASSEQRERIKEAFNDPRDPLRILVGTDTVSEGINLQATCRYVIHQDIPWNPMRLEQRNGRVDRHGQEREVRVFHFTSNDEADLQFMEQVVKKVHQARTDLGSVGQVIDKSIEEYFIEGKLTPDELDLRVREAQVEPQEQVDLHARDQGGRIYNARAMQLLDATEMELDLHAEQVAQLLMEAIKHENGRLEEIEDGRAYRLREIPPTWKKLVRETIERRRGTLQGMPKLVFDPAYFEEEHNGRKFFKPRLDAELIRLGHPLMQRALGVLRQRMWDGKGLARWTLQKSVLPPGIHKLLLVHLSLEVINAFREVAHQEIILVPYQVLGTHLVPLEPDFWEHQKHMPRFALTNAAMDHEVPVVREHWEAHQQALRALVSDQREALRQKFEEIMRQRLTEEAREEGTIFTGRLRELERMKQPQHLVALKREIARQEKKLLQPSWLEEIQQEQLVQEQHLADLKWQAEHTYLDNMKDLVVSEQKRVLEQVLPKRYTLAAVDIQPLTVEYIVHGTGREHK